MYPNPNNGNISLQQLIPDDLPVWVEIFNMKGDVIYKQRTNFVNGINKFNIKDLNTGIYLLQLKDNKGRIFTVKFSVIN